MSASDGNGGGDGGEVCGGEREGGEAANPPPDIEGGDPASV
jgi:hypothetical protein